MLCSCRRSLWMGRLSERRSSCGCGVEKAYRACHASAKQHLLSCVVDIEGPVWEFPRPSPPLPSLAFLCSLIWFKASMCHSLCLVRGIPKPV